MHSRSNSRLEMCRHETTFASVDGLGTLNPRSASPTHISVSPVIPAMSRWETFSLSRRILTRLLNESLHRSGNTFLPSGIVMTCTHSTMSGTAGGSDMHGASACQAPGSGLSLMAVFTMSSSSLSSGVSARGCSSVGQSLGFPFSQSLFTPTVIPALMDLPLRPSLVVGSRMRSEPLKILSAFS